MKYLDLSKINPAEICLTAAETLMTEYKKQMETNPFGKNNETYLHIAETNILGAEMQGMDASSHRERLNDLINKYCK